jgi:hypothetical protein
MIGLSIKGLLYADKIDENKGNFGKTEQFLEQNIDGLYKHTEKEINEIQGHGKDLENQHLILLKKGNDEDSASLSGEKKDEKANLHELTSQKRSQNLVDQKINNYENSPKIKTSSQLKFLGEKLKKLKKL